MAANNQLDVYKIILKKKKGFNFNNTSVNFLSKIKS